MLYKKVHRQHLREFWEGRRFEVRTYSSVNVYEVTSEPYIEGLDYQILVDRSDGYDMLLIPLCGLDKGKLRHKFPIIKWLD